MGTLVIIIINIIIIGNIYYYFYYFIFELHTVGCSRVREPQWGAHERTGPILAKIRAPWSPPYVVTIFAKETLKMLDGVNLV
jgi:hypothetical protein